MEHTHTKRKRWGKVKIKDMAVYCKSIEINCDICEHKRECEEMQSFLEDLSPYGVVQLVKENRDIGGD